MAVIRRVILNKMVQGLDWGKGSIKRELSVNDGDVYSIYQKRFVYMHTDTESSNRMFQQSISLTQESANTFHQSPSTVQNRGTVQARSSERPSKNKRITRKKCHF